MGLHKCKVCTKIGPQPKPTHANILNCIGPEPVPTHASILYCIGPEPRPTQANILYCIGPEPRPMQANILYCVLGWVNLYQKFEIEKYTVCGKLILPKKWKGIL